MEIEQNYCIDSDILIDFMRGVSHAHDFFLEQSRKRTLFISVASVAELWAGKATGRKNLRQKEEIEKLEKFIEGFEIIMLDEGLARRAGSLQCEYTTPFADSIIAASALGNGLCLATRNVRHFENIAEGENLKILTPY